MWRIAFVLAALGTAPAFAAGNVIHAGGGWVAIDRGPVCEALVRSVRVAAKGKVQATAGFTFAADRRRWGEFHVRLSRDSRSGSSIMLTIGEQRFLLVGRGGWGWSRGARQEQAIIAAARLAGAMQVEARDAAGRRFRDSYTLAGAPTAIDAAAARCAGKSLRK